MANRKQSVYANEPPMTLLLIEGLGAGIITGLLGIGGGFLIVPALYFLAGLPVKKAIGTALLIIALNACFGFLSSYNSMNLDWLLLVKFSLGAVVGVMVGSRLSHRMPADRVKKVFGWCVLCMAVYVAYKQFAH